MDMGGTRIKMMRRHQFQGNFMQFRGWDVW